MYALKCGQDFPFLQDTDAYGICEGGDVSGGLVHPRTSIGGGADLQRVACN